MTDPAPADPTPATPAPATPAPTTPGRPSPTPAFVPPAMPPGWRLPLGVLDLAVVGHGQTSRDALLSSTALAQTADRLGYSRYWVAEHHNIASVASTTPPVLIAHLAAATVRIRVGSGGVMLPNHPPLVVAEQFAMLEALHPGRIDLGFGRAPGSDPTTAVALWRRFAAGSEPEFAGEIQAVESLLAAQAGVDDLIATARAVSVPQIWVLGSSLSSALVAGALGLPYAFAHHFSGEHTVPAVQTYRRQFRPSAVLAEPRVLIATGVVAADTDEEARELALPAALGFLKLRKGVIETTPTAAEVHAYPWTQADRAFVADRLAHAALGTARTVLDTLDDLAAATGADELMLAVQAPDQATRRRTLELVAGELAGELSRELPGEPAAEPAVNPAGAGASGRRG